jgi:pimeloyl-ACP methyl ester carboxylesterase
LSLLILLLLISATTAAVPVVVIYSWPLRARTLSQAPASRVSFADAIAAADGTIAAEAADPAVRPQSQSRLLVHGARTRKAVVLLHGYTLGPDQFDELARRFFARGYNVWVPRAPGHGMADPRAHHRITAAELTAYAAESVNLAAALGDQVGVVGISGGAVLAAWLAQYRGDVVRHLLLLSPFFGPDPRQAPAFAVKPLIVLYGHRLLPDRVNSRGYSFSAVTQYLTITRNLPRPATRTGLMSIAVAISRNDGVVDPVAAVSLPGRIAAANGIPLAVYQPPESLGIGHNTLALAGLGADEAPLYQRYLDLYEGRAPQDHHQSSEGSAIC